MSNDAQRLAENIMDILPGTVGCGLRTLYVIPDLLNYIKSYEQGEASVKELANHIRKLTTGSEDTDLISETIAQLNELCEIFLLKDATMEDMFLREGKSLEDMKDIIEDVQVEIRTPMASKFSFYMFIDRLAKEMGCEGIEFSHEFFMAVLNDSFKSIKQTEDYLTNEVDCFHKKLSAADDRFEHFDEQIKNAEEKFEKANERTNQTSLELDSINERFIDAEVRIENINVSSLTVLGLFTAIVMALSGSFSFSSSLFSNVKSTNYLEIIFLFSVCGLVLFNCISIFIWVIACIHKIDRLLNRLKVIWIASNLILVIPMIIILIIRLQS